MAEQSHWELIFQSLERRILALCDSVKEQNATTNAVLVQLEGMAYRLAAVEAEIEAMKQKPRMAFRIGPLGIWRVIVIAFTVGMLAAMTLSDSQTGLLLGFLR